MTLVIAMVLDALAGEPAWLWSRVPHPAVLLGRVIDWADQRFNHGPDRRRNGILFCAALCLGAGGIGVALSALPFAPVWEILTVAILLAQRSLVDHVRAVADGLRLSDHDGRLMVARIVGRNTQGMDAPATSRAAIESAAENFSDGIVAPVFWFVLAGLPGILIYKAVNTADSMIGYRTPRHAAFGWASARLDDILNWLPARLSALMIATVTGSWRCWRQIRANAALHRSPNAGWPEAAMAHALDVALAGPRSYDGDMQDFAYVHPEGRRNPGPSEIEQAIRILWQSWGLLAVIGVLATIG